MFRWSHFAALLSVFFSFCSLPAEEDLFQYKSAKLAQLPASERLNYQKKKIQVYQQMVDTLKKDTKAPLGESGNLTGVKGNIQIHAKDIKKGGLRIDKPGYYSLVENILFNSSTPGSAAIIIQASNVVLDLNGHSIRQAGKKTDTIGIVISSNCHHIEIKNGTIENFSGTGIRVYGQSNSLLVDKMSVLSCGSAKGGLSSGGLVVADSQNLTVTHSKFLMNIGAGISLLGCSFAEIDQSLCSETQGTVIPIDPFKSGTSSWGLLAVFPNMSGGNIRVSNSSFNGCRGSFNSSGIVILDSGDNNISMENCICFDIQNTGAAGIAGREAVGVDLKANLVELKNCTANFIKNSKANSFATTGFSVAAQKMVVEDCHASEIEASASFGPQGFFVEKTDLKGMEVHLHRCIASNIKNLESNPATGFWFSETVEKTGEIHNLPMEADVDSCIAETIKSYSGTSGSGFTFSSQIGLVMQNCISNGNDVGILVNDAGVSATIGKIAYNKISNSSTFGIQDKSTSKNFLYFSNILQANKENFSGVPARPPVNWPAPVQPGKTDSDGTENGTIDPLDNINITS